MGITMSPQYALVVVSSFLMAMDSDDTVGTCTLEAYIPKIGVVR